MNEGLAGLERHEGDKINDRMFIFGWTIPLTSTSLNWVPTAYRISLFYFFTELTFFM